MDHSLKLTSSRKNIVTGVMVFLPLFSCYTAQSVAEDEVVNSGEIQFDDVLDGSTHGNARFSGRAIVDTCRTGDNGASDELGQQQFQADCNLIVGSVGSDTDGVIGALNALAADQVSAQNSASVRRNKSNVSVLGQRMALLRVSSGVSAYAPEQAIAQNHLFNGALGGGASADNEYGRLGVFVNGRFISGDEDEDTFQDGFDFDTWDLMAGVDYRFSDNLVAGIALNYADGDIDYDNNRGSLDVDAWGILAYGSYFLDSGLFFEGSLGYTDLDYSMTRNVTYTVAGSSADQQMQSNPDGSLLAMSVGVGQAYQHKSWSFTPSLRFDYLENDVDSYSESSTNLLSTGGAMALAVKSANYESMTANLGVQIARAQNISGGVLVPQIRIDWVHEFEDDGVGVKAHYLNDINRTSFKVETTALDADYFDLSLGVSAQLANGKSGFISYRTLLGYEGLSYDSIQLGFRIELP